MLYFCVKKRKVIVIFETLIGSVIVAQAPVPKHRSKRVLK